MVPQSPDWGWGLCPPAVAPCFAANGCEVHVVIMNYLGMTHKCDSDRQIDSDKQTKRLSDIKRCVSQRWAQLVASPK